MEKFPKIFDLEERLVRFAGEVIFFSNAIKYNFAVDYYSKQLIRSSGSSVLNYGEVQATITDKDYVFKLGIVLKELKESRSCLKVMRYVNFGDDIFRTELINECEELIAISTTLIRKKLGKERIK